MIGKSWSISGIRYTTGYSAIVDPVRNPYAPGAGQRPPELAGRDTELQSFDVALERVGRGRPERSFVLTGLRGVGKTVLLNALRSSAVRRGWGTGKLEIRPDRSVRQPLAAALHPAIRELGAPESESRNLLGVLKAFAQSEPVPVGGARSGRSAGRGAARIAPWQPGIDVAAVRGRADSGDMEIDLVELLTDLGALAGELGKGVALFIDELQDLTPVDVSALCAACHELGQRALPLMVVGAGLPHLPAVLSASKSYSERLFHYTRIGRLDRGAADAALQLPARDEGAEFTDAALDAMYSMTGGYPYFVQAYGKAAWDYAPRSPITDADVTLAAPGADSELAVGFFGSRFERATPAEREYLRAMAEVSDGAQASDDDAVATASIATALGRPAQSLSPARDALLKKGLVYSGQRGKIAFTVPHFGRYLRQQEML
jgi:AAA ATPase domain